MSDGIAQWNCSSRCWAEGGPHDDNCTVTHYVPKARLDAAEAVVEAARNTLNAARQGDRPYQLDVLEQALAVFDDRSPE